MAINLLSRDSLILLSTAILIIIGLFLLIRVRKLRNDHQSKKGNALDVSVIADITKGEFKPARFHIATQDAIPKEKKEMIPSARLLKIGVEGRFEENPDSKVPVKTPEPQPVIPKESVIAKNQDSKAPVKTTEPQPVIPKESVIAKKQESKKPVSISEFKPAIQEKELKLEDEITEMEEIPGKKVSNKKTVKKETEVVVEDIEKGKKISTRKKVSKKIKPVEKTPEVIVENIIAEETGEKIKKRIGRKKKASVQEESTV
jgi:hypothetical protein